MLGQANDAVTGTGFAGTVALQCTVVDQGNGALDVIGCSIPPSVASSGTTAPVTALLAVSAAFQTGYFMVTVTGTASNGAIKGGPVSASVIT